MTRRTLPLLAAIAATLPTLEETEAELGEAIQAIMSAATAIAPELRWEPADKRRQSSCSGPFGKTDGLAINLPNYVSAARIPDDDWPRILQAARDILAPLGITKVVVRVDKPGDHDVLLTSDDGRHVDLGTKVAALVSARTGCRLPTQRTEQTP